MKRLLLPLILLSFLGTSCSFGQVKKKAADKPSAAAGIESLLKKQILLTNEAVFTSNRLLAGGSGFLINYNGSNFAVSAKHLLGEAGGVEPEVNLKEIGKNLLEWRMSPRVVTDRGRETIRLSAAGLDYSNAASDLLLLKVASATFDFGILNPNFALPVAGETLYLIGCPYSETACRQNSYRLKFVEFDKTDQLLVCEIYSDVNLAGFSGSPVINGSGEAVGVLVSGAESGGKKYVMATHIKEIERIR